MSFPTIDSSECQYLVGSGETCCWVALFWIGLHDVRDPFFLTVHCIQTVRESVDSGLPTFVICTKLCW
jgi:hypothetical protein